MAEHKTIRVQWNSEIEQEWGAIAHRLWRVGASATAVIVGRRTEALLATTRVVLPRQDLLSQLVDDDRVRLRPHEQVLGHLTLNPARDPPAGEGALELRWTVDGRGIPDPIAPPRGVEFLESPSVRLVNASSGSHWSGDPSDPPLAFNLAEIAVPPIEAWSAFTVEPYPQAIEAYPAHLHVSYDLVAALGHLVATASRQRHVSMAQLVGGAGALEGNEAHFTVSAAVVPAQRCLTRTAEPVAASEWPQGARHLADAFVVPSRELFESWPPTQSGALFTLVARADPESDLVLQWRVLHRAAQPCFVHRARDRGQRPLNQSEGSLFSELELAFAFPDAPRLTAGQWLRLQQSPDSGAQLSPVAYPWRPVQPLVVAPAFAFVDAAARAPALRFSVGPMPALHLQKRQRFFESSAAPTAGPSGFAQWLCDEEWVRALYERAREGFAAYAPWLAWAKQCAPRFEHVFAGAAVNDEPLDLGEVVAFLLDLWERSAAGFARLPALQARYAAFGGTLTRRNGSQRPFQWLRAERFGSLSRMLNDHCVDKAAERVTRWPERLLLLLPGEQVYDIAQPLVFLTSPTPRGQAQLYRVETLISRCCTYHVDADGQWMWRSGMRTGRGAPDDAHPVFAYVFRTLIRV